VPLDVGASKPVRVYGVHFPSQANPKSWRKDAANTLNNLMLEAQAHSYVIAGGDFNVISKGKEKPDDKKPKPNEVSEIFTESDEIYKGIFSVNFQVSHLVACDSCEGTHFYKGEWDFLDTHVIPMDGEVGKLIKSSVKTPNEGRYQMKEDRKTGKMIPARFEKGEEEVGVSDHLPVYSEFIVK
jgi:hypothetical protein